jgi:hypothetical protein
MNRRQFISTGLATALMGKKAVATALTQSPPVAPMVPVIGAYADYPGICDLALNSMISYNVRYMVTAPPDASMRLRVKCDAL